MKLRYERPRPGAYARDVTALQQPIAKAVTRTFIEAAKTIESAGRANIAAAGLGKRFATGFRVRKSPRQISMSPSLKGLHQLGYANIFERGGTIKGKPLLWIPLPSAPAKIGGKRITPRLFVENVGPLVSINRPGKPPLLAGQSLRAVSTGRRATVGQLKTGARRTAARGAGGRGRRAVAVPLFIGIKSAHIRKRLSISPIYDRVRAQLGEIYLRQFEAEGKA